MDDSTLALIKDYFATVIGRGISTDSIRSFNTFLKNISSITKQLTPIDRDATYTIFNIYVEKPYLLIDQKSIPLLPSEAKLKKMNYCGNVYFDVTENEKIHHRINGGAIPIMVGSDACHTSTMNRREKIAKGEDPEDYGGYFIINGNERIVISHIRPSYNTVSVFQKKLSMKKVRSTEKYAYMAESRSISIETNHSILIQIALTLDQNVVMLFPQVKTHIPVGIVFKAFGYTSSEIVALIGLDSDEQLVRSILNECMLYTKELAVTYIANRLKNPVESHTIPDHIEKILTSEILPHMGIVPGQRIEKAMFVAKMVNKLILTVTKKRQLDRRDNLSKRRVDNAGVLVHGIFNLAVKKFEQELKDRCVSKRNSDPISIIPTINSITLILKKCISTGNWTPNPKTKTYHHKGVSQMRDNTNQITQISGATRVVIPSKSGIKNGEARLIDASSYGFFDPIDTPEGEQSGLNIQASIMTRVSSRADTVHLRELIKEHPAFVRLSFETLGEGFHTIYINGAVVGLTSDVDALMRSLCEARETRLISPEISLSVNSIDRDFIILSDEGRMLRPLFVVRNRSVCIPSSFEEGLKDNSIVYRDATELEHAHVAMRLSDLGRDGYTHSYAEIHPTCMFGAVSMIRLSFPANTPSPRNCYSLAMGKSSVMGLTSQRYDIKTHALVAPESPIVSTMFSREVMNNVKMGINVVIAIMSQGNNQEDAFVFNRGAIERGLFHSVRREVHSTEEKLDGESKYEIKPLTEEVKRKRLNYSKLDENGIIKEGTFVEEDDVLVSRALIKTKKDVSVITDSSLVYQEVRSGIVDRVIQTDSNGYKIVKVVVRNHLIPMVGDKFSSSKAQKGTIGSIVNHEDMPYTSSGIVPDVILNPHCIPSRMTFHQLIDVVFGKLCALEGEYGDSTPFTRSSDNIVEAIGARLMQNGASPHGKELMFDGTTGETIDAEIFIGITSNFDRLKHLSKDKCYARARGPITTVTRQPVEGRSRTGGLRIGEMERDALLGQGCAEFLKFPSITEKFSLRACDKCGNVINSGDSCTVCNSYKNREIAMPYTVNVLRHYLNSTGIRFALVEPEKA